MTQIAVKLPDGLLCDLDELVAQGDSASHNPGDAKEGGVSDPSMLYAWRCDDCGERESVDSTEAAEAGARDHRTVTHHAGIFTVAPEGETPPERSECGRRASRSCYRPWRLLAVSR